eukprot:gene12600-2301_t
MLVADAPAGQPSATGHDGRGQEGRRTLLVTPAPTYHQLASASAGVCLPRPLSTPSLRRTGSVGGLPSLLQSADPVSVRHPTTLPPQRGDGGAQFAAVVDQLGQGSARAQACPAFTCGLSAAITSHLKLASSDHLLY